MKAGAILRNPYLLFLPFLLFYVLYIIVLTDNKLVGDEARYLRDATNLANGFLSPPLPNITLFNGPGYPILELPFVLLDAPYLIVKLLNALFLYFSIVLLYKVLIPVVSFNKTLLCCFFWGMYYNSFNFLNKMQPEFLTVVLIALLLFLLTKAFVDGSTNRRYVIAAGIAFGYLALVKVIFGYVILCMLIGCGVLWLFNRKTVNYRKGALVSVIAFITVLPYLFYTWHITGRPMYWSSSGGSNLYWMSTLDDQEHGSWFSNPNLRNDSLVWNMPGKKVIPVQSDYMPGYLDSIIVHNDASLREIEKYDERPMEQDDVFKRMALQNIKSHPGKFVKNCFSNIGRMLFNFPYSYSIQKPSTLLRLPLNGIILVLILFATIPTFKNWRHIPFAIRFMLFASAIYLGGSVLVSAEVRMFTIIVPVLLAWLAYVFQRSVKINTGSWDK